MNGSARGTALVVLFVAVPALVRSMVAASRGSARAVIAWLGAAAYITYNSVLFLFATPFNELFLLYEAMLALSLWSMVAVLHAIDVPSFAARYSSRLPRRRSRLHAGDRRSEWPRWLAKVVPALMSGTPHSLTGQACPRPVFVQDLHCSSPDGGCGDLAVAVSHVMGLPGQRDPLPCTSSRAWAWLQTSGLVPRQIQHRL
jgi:hypothetical protein